MAGKDLARNLRDGTIKIQISDNGSGSAVEHEVKLEEGNLRWKEVRPVRLASDRGVLDHARRSPVDEAVEIEFSVMFTVFQDPNSATVTMYEFMTGTGGASAYLSQDQQTDAYSVNLEFTIAEPSGGTAEVINFDYFHVEDIEFEEGGDDVTMLRVRGRAPLHFPDFWWRAVDNLKPSKGSRGVFTRAGTATYKDAVGVLQTALAGQLRSNHHFGGTQTAGTRCALLEQARTNDFTRSQDFANAAWTKSNTSVSGSAFTSPSGGTDAEKIIEDSAASSTHYVARNTPTLTNDTFQSFSVFAKAQERTEIRMLITSKAGTSLLVWFNLSAGTVGTQSGATGEIEALQNSWFRCTISADCGNGGTTPNVNVNLGSGSETSNYNGDGSSGVLLWGAQFETDQKYQTSYIPTVASTVTRVADLLYFPLPGNISTPQELTAYVHYIERGSTLVSGDNNRILHIGSATAAADARLTIREGSAKPTLAHDNTSTEVSAIIGTGPVLGDRTEIRGILGADGAVEIGQSIANATETTTDDATANTLQAAWAGTRIYINSAGTTKDGWNAFIEVHIARRTRTMDSFRKIR